MGPAPTFAPTPASHGLLDVGDGHRVHWEEWGARDGVPMLYLHGGPGGTLRDSSYRHHFDLARTRLVALDQRGCGRSLPHASDPAVSLTAHTVPLMVEDLELLRRHLGIETWVVSGASWGCTLALAYAQTHPHRVRGLVGYAVTTTSRAEVDWITEGVGALAPEAWDRFAGHAESAVGHRRGQGRLVEAYARLMASPDPEVRDAATLEWARWEDAHVSIGTDVVRRDPRWDDDRFRHAFVRLTTHHWTELGRPGKELGLLEGASRLADVPGILLHGRRDVSSPVTTAEALVRRWPAARLEVDEDDGHGGPSLAQRWRAAHDEMVERAAQAYG